MARREERSTRALKADDSRRSKQPWERARGAPKIGNPRYYKDTVTDKNGVLRTVYRVRPY